MSEVKGPKVSIITASYNCWSHLEKTLKSLINYPYENIQHIVVDGGSSDGTVEKIKAYIDRIDVFISEPDEGIADAWNKGLQHAVGDFIGLLNSGDEYHKNFLIQSIENIRGESLALSYGETYMVTEEGRVICKVSAAFNPKMMSQSFGFLHTSVLAHRSVYETVGNFEKKFKIALDVDWLLRAFKKDVRFLKSSAKNYMVVGGVSEKHKSRARKEYKTALIDHGLLSPEKVTRHDLYFVFIRCLEFFNIFAIRARVKTQLIFMALHAFNVAHRYLPFFACRKFLYRLAAFDVHPTAVIQPAGEFFSFRRLRIGKGSVINKNFKLDNRTGIEIGENVSIAHDVEIYTLGHDINCEIFSTTGKPVVVEDNAVIFASVKIMPGVRIGRGSVVYPGSIVVKDVPPLAVVGGNPARIISNRECRLAYDLKYDYWFAH